MAVVRAKFGLTLPDGKVKCQLCPLECIIPEGKAGVCRFRQNLNGNLVLANYGDLVELALENIEKKPLHHFYPGTKILSIGSNGCNMACSFCQNYQVSQLTYPTQSLSPQELLIKVQETPNNLGICYTFNEPLTWFEYLLDSARLVKAAGYQVVINTNGLINPGPLLELLPYISAINLDLKGFSDRYYQKICKAPLKPVLETAIALSKHRIFFEISHLIIPEENGSETEPLGKWILDNLGDKVPIHLNAYYPRYLMSHPATQEEVVLQAWKKYQDMGHKFVYPGNVLTSKGRNTYCYSCGTLLVERLFSKVTKYLVDSCCPNCAVDNKIVQ